MKFKPHDYQAYAIEQVVNNNSVGLLLDMGLGKTVITLTAIQRLKDDFAIDKALVIAPLQTAWNTWTAEQEKWSHLKGLSISLVLGSAKERESALKANADVYVINRENVQWLCEYLDDWPFDMLVIDELSSFKNPKAKRFKALRKKLPYFNRVVGLTGTPASNGYMDLWSEMYLLDRGERLGKTLGKYRDVYFDPGRRNGYVIYEWKLKDGAKAKVDKKLSDLCVSMKAVDFLKMPERIETEVYVQLDKKERDLYDRFGKDHVLPEAEVIATQAATVQGKLLQMANGFVYDESKKAHHIHDKKLDALEELVEASASENVLVFYSFIEDKNRICERFPDAVVLTGKKEVDDWNAGKIKMLLCHPASAGHGLNLQDGGRTTIWYGLPWSLELYQQANARLYRQGQKQTVKVFHILTKDTHDDDVLNALREKNLTQEELLRALKARLRNWGN